jgi:fatty acid-binding protein DegV
MGKIGIVTDSVTYLTPEQVEELQVEVVSLVINFGDQSWPEASVSDYTDFYEQLRRVSYLPTTWPARWTASSPFIFQRASAELCRLPGLLPG